MSAKNLLAQDIKDMMDECEEVVGGTIDSQTLSEADLIWMNFELFGEDAMTDMALRCWILLDKISKTLITGQKKTA